MVQSCYYVKLPSNPEVLVLLLIKSLNLDDTYVLQNQNTKMKKKGKFFLC